MAGKGSFVSGAELTEEVQAAEEEEKNPNRLIGVIMDGFGPSLKWHAAFLIDLKDREGWAVYRLCDAKSGGKALGKNGFSRAEVAVQCINLSRLRLSAQFFTEGKGFFGTSCLNHHIFSPFLGFLLIDTVKEYLI